MSGWSVGDLAVCVDDTFDYGEMDKLVDWHPKLRGIYRVAGVDAYCFNDGTVGLDFVEDPECGDPEAMWSSDAFRKILPADPAFAEKMRSLKPRVDA